jgi:opacity protein-like surface antigen
VASRVTLIVSSLYSGFSLSPVLALAFHKDNWDASVRYEFKMGTDLKIKSAEASAKDPVINSISAWSFGVGFAYKITDAIRLNVGYMPTVYDKVTAVGQASGIDFKDIYSRTSNACGIGLDFKF